MILTNYITENKEQFLAHLVNYCGLLFIDPDWLLAVMYKESRIDHRAVNTHSGATGLIQFMPATAAALGTTTAALKAMSNVQQLEYVYKYLKPYKGKMNSYTDTYLAVFFPAALGKGSAYVLATANLPAGTVASWNPGVDLNNDNKITVAEFEKYALAGFSIDIQNILKKKS